MKMAQMLYGALLAGLTSMPLQAGRATPAPPGQHTRQYTRAAPGAGVGRAQRRWVAKLKANRAIPPASRLTRQQRRAQTRIEAKRLRLTPAEYGRRKMAARRMSRETPDRGAA
ncbi:hypothetical protein [Ruegeria sp.]|uniref:hypothetical protein n=1 Tax=Ruegeria sp. TaxID=1879320 RepID=UPI003B002A6E